MADLLGDVRAETRDPLFPDRLQGHHLASKRAAIQAAREELGPKAKENMDFMLSNKPGSLFWSWVGASAGEVKAALLARQKVIAEDPRIIAAGQAGACRAEEVWLEDSWRKAPAQCLELEALLTNTAGLKATDFISAWNFAYNAESREFENASMFLSGIETLSAMRAKPDYIEKLRPVHERQERESAQLEAAPAPTPVRKPKASTPAP